MEVKASRAVAAVADGIHRDIRDGRLSLGEMLPSESELATSFGVSRGTVRKAIDHLVASGVVKRRPYSRPTIESFPGTKSTGNEVYVWVSRPIADMQALSLLKEISQALRGTTYRMVVREPSRFIGNVVQTEEREFLLGLLKNPDAAGAIMESDPFSKNGDVLSELIAKDKHLVFVDTPPPRGVAADFVGTSNTVAARLSTEHLLDLGHSRIFCVVDSDVPQVSQDRISGYRRAMAQAGVEKLGEVVVAADLPKEAPSELAIGGPFATVIKKSEYFQSLATRIVHHVLNAQPRPTALFICQDVLAFWVCALLAGMKISVPEDISVVGFDRLAQWDSAIPDFLTSASQNFDGFGRHAANMLLDRLTGEAPPERRHVLLEAPLVVRSSTTSDLLMPSIEAVSSPSAFTPVSSYEKKL